MPPEVSRHGFCRFSELFCFRFWFVKRSLSLLNMQVPLKNMEAVMFTVEDLSPRMVDVLSRVAAGLQLKIKNIYFQILTISILVKN